MRQQLAASILLALPTLVSAQEDPIIHDAEHYILLEQHGQTWSEQDARIDDRLAEIRETNGGTPPNIVYILLDDVGFGEMGMPNLDVIRGYSTPHISDLAEEALSFQRMYTEPSCTPTRAAMMTGRYAIRTGTTEAKSVVSGDGLNRWEVTLAEVLSAGGYETVHIGKWHLGDIEQSYAFNQGFDYAEHPVHQQGQMAIMNADAEREGISTGLSQRTRANTYELDKSFRLNPHAMVYGIVGEKGGTAREVNFEAGEVYTQAHYQRMEEGYKDAVLDQLDRLAGGEKPFFLNYWPQLPISLTRSDLDGAKTLNGGPIAESLVTVDTWIGEILAKIDELGIAENTIVVVMGDNGPFMQYREYSGQNDRIYRGGKTDHLEGGVRVNAFMRWPAAIEGGSRVQDIIHVTDLYTTLARLAGSDQHIPRDRLIDGVDQSPLIFVGDSHGRRDYVFIYEGPALRSIVKQQFKFHLPEPGANPIAAPVFDLYKDSREERIDTAKTIPLGVGFGGPFVGMMKRHLGWKQKYHDRDQGHDIPYGGIESLRPETQVLVDGFTMVQELMGK
ncbi:sulfatase-like hydrolase/transferase [Phaeobacter marinintestinus]|uniref:sulfatase-like hydrolase/transferase n=1 Tax=Falsiphaeobacter marinintestinus TaxID=1492905 RepID=UPI0011B5896C|nr:sulfatase-like hydrolase/transferase [Phaeobacter marinintestinus]